MSSSPELNVLIYGLGAIGSFYTFILSRNENVRLTVVARSNYEAVKANGISIDSENHGKHAFRPVNVVKTPAEAGAKFDYIVCAHKAIGQDAVPEQLAPAVDEEKTTIVIIQNGVGNEEPFRARFPSTTILSCVTWVGARQPEPGVITHTKSENMQIGLYPNKAHSADVENSRLDTFSSLLKTGKTVFTVVPNIQVQRWEKVVWNVAWNAITTLTLNDTHAWLSSSAGAEPMTRRLMAEVIKVAQACDVPIDNDLIDVLITRIKDMATITSSMYVDFKTGKPLEVDIILGYPVKKAREFGIDAPTLETLYLLLTAVNNKLLEGST